MMNKTPLPSAERAQLVTLLTTVRESAGTREAYFQMLDELIERFGREAELAGTGPIESIRKAQRAAHRVIGSLTEQLFGWSAPKAN